MKARVETRSAPAEGRNHPGTLDIGAATALALLSLFGCARQGSPTALGAGHAPTGATPSPESARLALIDYTKLANEALPEFGDRALIARILESPAELRRLKNHPVRGGEGDVWIADCYCRPDELAFERGFTLPGGHRLELVGRFEPLDARGWRAKTVEVRHPNTGPALR